MMNKKNKRGFASLSLGLIMIVALFFSGILGGVTYYTMDQFDIAINTINFDLPYPDYENNITEFQDIAEIVIYPILDLKDSLIYITYFFIFATVIAMTMSALVSNKHPAFFALHILIVIALTIFAMIISNTYEQMLMQESLRVIMSPFTIYNKIMLYLPQFIAFVGLSGGLLSYSGIIKARNQSNVNYGDEF